MPRYRYVVDEAAFTTLLALRDEEIAALLPTIEYLTENPFGSADFYSVDRQGRRLPHKIAGAFFLTYWCDAGSSTVYILQIDRLDG
jgi:hypothetical protein